MKTNPNDYAKSIIYFVMLLFTKLLRILCPFISRRESETKYDV